MIIVREQSKKHRKEPFQASYFRDDWLCDDGDDGHVNVEFLKKYFIKNHLLTVKEPIQISDIGKILKLHYT